jgi:YcxB-like protein
MVEQPRARSGDPFDDSVFGACLLTLADFTDAISHEPRTRRFVRIALGIGLCLGIAGVALLARQRTLQGAALLGLSLFSTLAYNAPEQIAGRWYAKTPPNARAVKLTLNPQGLVVVSDIGKQFQPWVKLHGVSEAPDTFMVWLDEKMFVVIPKRAFAAGDLERASRLLHARLGEKQRDPRPFLPLWAVALLGVALLLLWNWLWPR